MNVFYAAYGSNMSTKQMDLRCQHSKFVSVGMLPMHRLVFASYAQSWRGAVADIECTDRDADQVPVLIYRLGDGDLEKLDGFEGYPDKYQRKQMFVTGRDGKLYKCWTYMLSKRHAGKYGIPSGVYYAQIVRAYLRFKIDISYIRRQREFSELHQIDFPVSEFDF